MFYFKAVNKENLAHISDQELLEKFTQTGDNQWLGYLLQRYTMLLLGVCMKYLKNEEEAKDSVQQIFLKVITELKKYKVDYFKSWLYMVARNHCLMKLRDRQGKIPKALDESVIIPETPADNAGLLEKEHILDLVNTSLPLLNEEQKTCVTLFYLQKKSYQEISDLTGFSASQVKSYIQNGKRNIKLLVEKKMKED
jgi:RNA polymerase sigma-70 factor (ECF subfamily)